MREKGAILARAAMAVSLIAIATAAQSQTSTPPITDTPAAAGSGASDQAQDIIVTGSRIRHSPLDQAAPVTFVDKADIDRTGLSSIADVLQRLPGAGGGLNSKTNFSGNVGNPANGGGVGAGSAEVNLRTLGSNRTLVMVDSLRYVNGASASGVPGSVDLNAIPNAAIERVEVLQDGASSIYGSDAIAGVVNIITKTKQKGFQGSAQQGLFKQGDGFTQNYDMSYGFGSEASGTQVVVGGSYVNQKPVFAADRALSRFPAPYATACGSNCSGSALTGRFQLSGDRDLTYDTATGGYRDFTTADRFNYAPYNYFLTPYEQIGAFASVEQKLGSNMKFSTKFFYNRRNSKNEAAYLPLGIGPGNGTGNGSTIVIDASNPYNPFGTLVPGVDYDAINRRVVEGGLRRYDQHVDTYYGTATLSGSFKALGHDWYWDVNGVYGKNKARQTMRGNIDTSKLRQALGPIADCTGACVPLDLFHGPGSITPAMLDYIGFVERDRSQQQLWDVTANLSGSIIDLPAGPLGVAVGYEHRDQKGSFDPDPVVAAGNGSDIAALPTAGHFNADEVYGELSIPLLKDKPFFNKLDGSFAVRYSNYSTSGSQTTLKGGLNWKPVEDLMLRGTYAEGYRAPSIGELYGSASRADTVVDDPCSLDSSSAQNINNNGTIAANCRAQGVPAGYVQAGSQKGVVTGGNQSLKAETSKSWVGGAVYSASWARGWARTLTLEANYFNIKIDNAIRAIGADTLIGRCVSVDDAASCAAITRAPSGNISQIVGLLQNIGSIKTSGMDVNFNYRSPDTGMGAFGLYWANTFMFAWTETVPATEGFTKIKRVGTEAGSANDQAYPRYRSTATLDWSLGRFKASITGRYISGVHEAQDGDNHYMNRRLYGDIQLGYDVKMADRDFNFTLGVNNITGTSPPACLTCSLNSADPTTYDVPGQFLYARVAVKM
jgi:iron complex outermembrane recepter protein